MKTGKNEIDKKIIYGLSSYLKGQLIIMLLNGLVIWLILTVSKVKFALVFALITAFLSTVPTFGMLTSALIIFIFSIFDGNQFSGLSPVIEGLLILLFIVIFNQLIDFVVSTLIIGKLIKISPVFLFLAVIASTSIFGIIGALLAVPVLIVVKALSESVKK